MAASKSSKASSTADLLKWSDEPPQPSLQTPLRRQPADGISSILLGAPLTPEEAEALRIKKQNSELKKREMSGSGIFSQDADDGNAPASVDKPTGRAHQPACEVSQILFGEGGSISPKKPTTVPEVAKQKELSGNLETPAEDFHSKKSSSTAKVKELVGSNIFGPPPEVQPRTLSRDFDNSDSFPSMASPSSTLPKSTLAAFGVEDQDLSTKKINTHKVAELSGNNIFKDDPPPPVSEKPLSEAKRKEISGNDIFADEKPAVRDHLGGIRKPPGGGSSITLV